MTPDDRAIIEELSASVRELTEAVRALTDAALDEGIEFEADFDMDDLPEDGEVH